MAIDLSFGALNSTLPASLVAGDVIKSSANTSLYCTGDPSDATAIKSLRPTVQFFLRPVGIDDTANDVAVSKPIVVKSIKADKAKPISAKLSVPTSTPEGDYKVVALVDAANAIVESDDANNQSVGEAPTSVAAPAVHFSITPISVPFSGTVKPRSKGTVAFDFGYEGNITLKNMIGFTVFFADEERTVGTSLVSKFIHYKLVPGSFTSHMEFKLKLPKDIDPTLSLTLQVNISPNFELPVSPRLVGVILDPTPFQVGNGPGVSPGRVVVTNFHPTKTTKAGGNIIEIGTVDIGGTTANYGYQANAGSISVNGDNFAVSIISLTRKVPKTLEGKSVRLLDSAVGALGTGFILAIINGEIIDTRSEPGLVYISID